MREDVAVQRFSADVDRLIATGGQLDGPGGDDKYAELLALAQRLAETDLSGGSAHHRELRRHLIGGSTRRNATAGFLNNNEGAQLMKTQQVKRNGPKLALAIAVALALMSLFTVPGRSFAREVLQQLGLVSNEPTSAQTHISSPEPPPPGPEQPTAAPPVLSSEQVYKPGYLPAGYSAEPGYGGMVYVNKTAGSEDLVSIYTRELDAGPLAIGDAETTPVTVRGKEGVFVDQAELYIKDKGGPMYQGELETAAVNLVIWEEDGVSVIVESAVLSQDELIKIAESLTR